ncbi:short-chain dehydrogenase/reductase family 16C member 6 [Episyrphus balteatus]|uniref:short-chain dehydrogenase/reductase family 16C member 6 n=1 Tax=Episyrphus balteatus TaxID=286459 RepID=UPI0024869C0D|nr:short-chain dehydrogenase/reductase family 16C member 6 [Episyrphus balteatus]
MTNHEVDQDNTQQQNHPNRNFCYGTILLILDIIIINLKFWFYTFEHIYLSFYQKEEKDVRGEIVLITGTAHGIGRDTALEYASKGATIVCWDINERGNNETVKEIKAMGGKAFSYVCNVSKREDIVQVAEKVKKEVGFVSILVNNAGIMPCHPLLDHNENEIRLMYDINVLAHFWMIQEFLPEMIKQKRGHIIALSSCAGLIGLKNLVPYCGTKFAVRGVMNSFYEELRRMDLHKQIKLTTIYPYMVDTGLCKKPHFRFKSMKLVKPQEVAKTIVSAQRRGIMELSIPQHYLYLEKFINIFPRKACEVVSDFLDTGVESDL